MATFKYIVKRLVLALFVFVVIMTMCFFLVKLLPQIPAEQFGKDQATIELRREQLGYNKPLPEQYFIFWGQALKGNWGLSETLYPMSDVWQTFVDKLPYSMALNLYSTLISIPIGIAFGIFAALKKNKWQDQVISTGVMVVISVPVFIYGMLIQYLLCYKLKWFNHTIDYTQGAFAASTFVGMIPAIITLSFGSIAGLCRSVRAELSDVLTSEFMLLARTKGLTKSQATLRHALRNAMVSILPSIIGSFVGIFSGSIVTEKIFGIAGIGNLMLKAVGTIPPDYNIFMLDTAFYTGIGLLAGVVVDLSYSFIDPRVKVGSTK